MSNTIKLKRGSGSDPSASDLVTGEIAVRTDTGKLFTKKDDGTVAEISGGSGSGQSASEILTLIKTVDGSGSGLDADLLDGIHASSFARSDATDTLTGELTLSNNLLKFSGTSNDRTLIHFIKSNEIKWRLLQNSSGESLNFHRMNGTGEFRVQGYRVLTTNDEGSGNGIDADTLDGQEGSYYTNAANLTGTLPAIDGSNLTNLPSISDGDKGDITVSNSGATFTIDNGVVTSAKIADGAIVNADINASAAIDGSKITPTFTSNFTASGSTHKFTSGTSGDCSLVIEADTDNNNENDTPQLIFRQDGGIDVSAIGMNYTGSTSLNQLYIANSVSNGGIVFYTGTTNGYGNGTERLKIDPNGQVDFSGNVDCNSGLDVTGDITGTGNLHLDNDNTKVLIGDGSDLQLFHNGTHSFIQEKGYGGGNLYVDSGYDLVFRVNTNESAITCSANGGVNLFHNSLSKFTTTSSGISVVGNVVVSGTVDGVDVATRDTLFGGLTSSSGVLTNGVTATTQSAGDNSTKVATTAYTDTAISNLINGAPAALDTLNELAAAMNDDAAFSTTVTNSLATKMPLAGGQFTGNITFSGSQTVDGRDLSVDGAKLDGIETGATADQTASEILTLIKTVDGSGSGLDADTLDGIDSSNFLRSNADDEMFGLLTLRNSNSNEVLVLRAAAPFIRFQENGTNKAGIQWHQNGYLSFSNSEDGSQLRLQDDIKFSQDGSTFYSIWHAGNDGSGSGLDSDTLDGQEGSYYTNASNLSSGTIPAARVPTLNQNTTGSAATLTTARTIAGVSFNGSANISLNNNAITNGAGYIDGSALNASNLSSGTIPDARFPSTLPAISGANLTNLPSSDTTSDSQFNTVGGTNSGDTFSGTNAQFNTLYGYNTGTDITTGDGNTHIGAQAGESVATHGYTTFVGYKAGQSNTDNWSVAIGAESLKEATVRGTAVGGMSLQNVTTGFANTGVGYQAGKSITTGYQNTFVGDSSGDAVTTGYQNNGFGNSTLTDLTTGDQNQAVGSAALQAVTTGNSNAGIGYRAGRRLTTGNSNILIGHDAGEFLTTGSNNIAIGSAVLTNSATVSNEITIGAGTTGGGSNTVTLGNGSITKLRVPGINVILKDNGGTPTQGHILTVDSNGEASFEAASSGGLSSDAQLNTVGGTNAGDSFSGTDATNNTLLGYNAGTGITGGDNNVAVGKDALFTTTDGYRNTIIGTQAAYSCDGNQNSVLGFQAGYSLDNASNTALFGYQAGYSVTSGHRSTAFGFNALKNATTAQNNVAIGPQALQETTTGASNIGIGYKAGYSITTGQNNTIIGRETGDAITTANFNSIVGATSGSGLTTGQSNSFLGYQIAYSATTASYNVGIGRNAFEQLSSGQFNVGIGYQAADNISSGSSNTCVGQYAGDTLTTGSNNTCLGNNATPSAATVSNEITLGNSSVTKFRIPGIDVVLKDNGGTPTQGHVLTVDANGEAAFAAASSGVSSDSQFNTVGGTNAGDSFSGTDAIQNTLFGYDAGTDITTADYNTAIGYKAGANATTGGLNTLIGRHAGLSISTGSQNVAVGMDTLDACTSGTHNVAMGVAAAGDMTTGAGNVAIGVSALQKTTTGSYNTAIGHSAGWQGTLTGSQNAIIGYYAGQKLTSASNNVIAGSGAGGDVTTGSNNTLLGKGAGNTGTNDLTTGDNNILIGYNAAASAATVSNEATIGDSNVNKFRIPGVSFEVSASAVTNGGAFYENAKTVTANYTLSGANAMAAGPITVNSGITVTVSSGDTLTIV